MITAIFVVYLSCVHRIAEFVALSNANSDLSTYREGAKYFGIAYFEPIPAIYFWVAQVTSEYLSYSQFLSLASASIFYLFILICLRYGTSVWIIVFWFLTLGFLLPLINLRFVVFLLVLCVLPMRLNRWISPMCHWSLLVFWIPEKFSVRRFLFAMMFLGLVAFIAYDGLLYGKLIYYFRNFEVSYGPAIFILSIALHFALREIYTKSGKGTALLNILTAMTFAAASLGFPALAGRLFSLNVFSSTYFLFLTPSVRISVLSRLLLLTVGAYEMYRQAKMLGLL